jgi:D-3-phosphoglycerate dehydrogenase / 2-oxoglutarate reductase
MTPAQIKILVADDVSETGLQPLRDAGFTVEKRIRLNPAELWEAISDCAGLVVRSETKVTSELMDSAAALRVVGRAGVGVDNIDVPAATERGIVVMNAPDGNTITTAEHTIALLISLARRVPQATASVKSGRWDRKSFIGVELQGKTLGVIGLGRIGKSVSDRALAFGMKVVAFDPFIAPEQAPDLEIELASLEQLFAIADFITIHTPLTPETRDVIGHDAFAKMKKGVRIINCARGGLVDEDALYDAIKSGTVAGAALDVFISEPPPADHPLLLLDEVIATPHLGASTAEAQEGVAFTVAEQMRDYLLNGALRGAVNVPVLGTRERALWPYIELAEKLGRFQAQLTSSAVLEVKLEFSGDIVEPKVAALKRSFLAGLLRDMSDRVTVVNAFAIADERRIDVTTTHRGTGPDFVPAIRTHVIAHDSEQILAGTIFGFGEQIREGRITEIDGILIEAKASGHLLITRSQDVPGVIGDIGACLGTLGINISNFQLGRHKPGGEALAVIRTDQKVDDAGLAAVYSLKHILSVKRVEL